MEIPREIYDTWKAVADKFKFLHQGTDDERREATKRGVQTIRARFRGRGGVLEGTKWVAKSEHNTGWSAQSKDALAYVEEGPSITGRLARMEMFDMINGSSRETNPFPVHSHNHTETPPNDDAFILVPDDFDWIEAGGPTPPPVDNTHTYDGGGNDTGVCDVCGQDRHADIHKTPQSKAPHSYNGGEQDTGLCDICQKPLADAIHGSVTPPPNSDLEARVTELEAQVFDLEKRVAVLEADSSESGGVSEEWVKAQINQALGSIIVEVQINQALASVLRHKHDATTVVKYQVK